MMNLITSDCIGGRYFQYKNSQYQNPFIWNSFLLSDFIYLIKNWNTINFNKIDIKFTDNEYGTFKHVPTIIIDNKIKIFFHHHFEDKKCLTPVKIHKDVDDIDLGYYDILNYLKEKYTLRVLRMSKENPVFLYNEKPFANNMDIMNFINLETPYKKILITKNKKYKQFESDKLLIYIKPYDIMNSTTLCNDLIKNNILY